MIIMGSAKGHRYDGDGTLQIKVRIPLIHGPYKEVEYNGKTSRNYVRDEDLPYYTSLLLPHIPGEGEVVALASVNNSNQRWIVIGLTGGVYSAGFTNVEG